MSALGVSLLGVWGYLPIGNFANVVSLKWHFLHFNMIFVVFCKVFILTTGVLVIFVHHNRVRLLALWPYAQHEVFNGETGQDIVA